MHGGALRCLRPVRLQRAYCQIHHAARLAQRPSRRRRTLRRVACTHEHNDSLVGETGGGFRTAASATYPPALNAALANVFIGLLRYGTVCPSVVPNDDARVGIVASPPDPLDKWAADLGLDDMELDYVLNGANDPCTLGVTCHKCDADESDPLKLLFVQSTLAPNNYETPLRPCAQVYHILLYV